MAKISEWISFVLMLTVILSIMVCDVVSDFMCSIVIILIATMIVFKDSIIGGNYCNISYANETSKESELYELGIQKIKQKLFILCIISISIIVGLRVLNNHNYYVSLTSTMTAILISLSFVYIFRSDIKNIINRSDVGKIGLVLKDEYDYLSNIYQKSLIIIGLSAIITILYSLALSSSPVLANVFYLAIVGAIYYCYKNTCIKDNSTLNRKSKYDIPKQQHYRHKHGAECCG